MYITLPNSAHVGIVLVLCAWWKIRTLEAQDHIWDYKVSMGKFQLRTQGGRKKKNLEILIRNHVHSSVLAWRIPGMGEPGGLPSMGPHRVGHD